MGTNSNAQLLAKLDAAFKAITEVTDLGDSILQPQKFDRFVREMQHRTVILPQARFIEMEAQQTDIDRTGFVGRILRSGAAGDGTVRVLADNEFANPAFATNKLIAQELQAITSIRDHALRRNIERGKFEDTLVDLFAEAAGRDLEEFALLSDSGWAHADDDVLSKTDGWIALAAQKLYGRQTGGATQVAPDFDPTDAAYPENVFQAVLDALPKQFLQDASEWRFWVPWSVGDAYRDQLRARGTQLGDDVLTKGTLPPYKGIPVEYAPLIERAGAVNLADDAQLLRDRVEGNIVLLGHPDNLAWGVFHEVTIEPDRVPKGRRTDYVLTIEADAHYEDENASVAAFIDKANPTAA